MVELQMFGVEEESIQVCEGCAMTAVATVAHDRMADGLEVHADLVRTTGVE